MPANVCPLTRGRGQTPMTMGNVNVCVGGGGGGGGGGVHSFRIQFGACIRQVCKDESYG